MRVLTGNAWRRRMTRRVTATKWGAPGKGFAMLLVPYGVDVTMYRWPVANFTLIGVITAVSFAGFGAAPGEGLDLLTLRGMGLVGLFGHVFLHGGLMHLLGNMLFLWSFGNAVCAKMGNWTFAGLFFLLGALAGTIHNLFDGAPAIGASGPSTGWWGCFSCIFRAMTYNFSGPSSCGLGPSA